MLIFAGIATPRWFAAVGTAVGEVRESVSGSLAMAIAPAARSLSGQRHLEAAFGSRPCHHRFVPTLDVGEIGKIHLVPLVPPGPAQDGEIGDRDRPGSEFNGRQALVEHAVEAAGFLRIALQPVAAVLLVLDLE